MAVPGCGPDCGEMPWGRPPLCDVTCPWGADAHSIWGPAMAPVCPGTGLSKSAPSCSRSPPNMDMPGWPAGGSIHPARLGAWARWLNSRPGVTHGFHTQT